MGFFSKKCVCNLVIPKPPPRSGCSWSCTLCPGRRPRLRTGSEGGRSRGLGLSWEGTGNCPGMGWAGDVGLELGSLVWDWGHWSGTGDGLIWD